MSDIKVSIVCNVYNQEEYIREALDSFVSQKTDFGFEVLVHDDASTDASADIIREYEAKYPDIIKPIYQTENQYSQNISISMTYQFPRARGKYIAFCEGDDYWTDEYKLQKQYDAMEAHPEVDICAHAAETRSASTGKLVYTTAPKSENTVIPIEEVIAGDGGFVVTNSLFFRASLNESVPKFRRFYGIDYALQMHGALRGGMLYLSDCMSVYRYMANGSWTRRTTKSKTFKKAENSMKYKMLRLFDEDTDGKYHSAVEEKLLWIELLCEQRAKDIFSEKYHVLTNRMSLLGKIKLYLKIRCPRLVAFTRRIR